MPSDRPFRLLDLPQEIRAMIFVELLVVENWIYDRDFDDTGVLQTMYFALRAVLGSIGTDLILVVEGRM